MSKKEKAPKAPKVPKEKRERKERAPNKPWTAKQTERVAKIAKMVERLEASYTKVHPPCGSELIAELVETLVSVQEQLTELGDWKPSKSGKASVGAIIVVKPEHLEAPVFQHVDAEVFAGGTVVGDDGNDWLIKCLDEQTRVLKKKYTALSA